MPGVKAGFRQGMVIRSCFSGFELPEAHSIHRLHAVIRNIIFDWSGTLVDDLPAVWEATNEVLRQVGKPPMALDHFRSEFSLPFMNFYRVHTPGVPRARLEKWFHAAIEKAHDAVLVLPHAVAFLETCRKQGIRLFLLSSIHPRHYRRQSKAGGLNAYFEKAYVGVSDKTKKIRDLILRNRLQPDETLFVGDMEHDIAAARHGKIHSCAVLTGYNTLDQLRRERPELVVQHLGELQKRLVQNHWEWRAACQTCQIEPQPLSTVGGLIYDHQGRVLMIRTHKWSNLWGIPGGKIKWGESSLDALKRELLEETGLLISRIRLVLVQDCIRSPEFYHDAHFILLNYTCLSRSPKPKVVLNDEGYEFRWVEPLEAMELPLNTPTRILLEAVLSEGMRVVPDKVSGRSPRKIAPKHR